MKIRSNFTVFARATLLALCLSLLLCCGKTDSDKSAAGQACDGNLETNEVEVTSLVVTSLSSKNFPQGKTLIIVNETVDNESDKSLLENLKSINQKFPNIEGRIVADFEAKNRVRRSFDKALPVPHKYEYISAAEFQQLARRNPYLEKNDPLVNRFPDSIGSTGIVGFSRAGFNEDFSKAIIYAFRWYDRGSFFLLEKENCAWSIKQEQTVWMH